MSARTVPCSARVVDGRLRKARQFFEAAELLRDLADDEAETGDVYVTLCVHAGIAAADVLCCRTLGEHASGENHADAFGLLAKVDKKLANDLRVLLGMKTKAGYDYGEVTVDQRKRAGRAAQRLVDATR